MFEGMEKYKEVKSCCPCLDPVHSVETRYVAQHTEDMIFSTLNVDGNLFHAHTSTEDICDVVSTFGGKSVKKPCCAGCACAGFKCCECAPPVDGSWDAYVQFEEDLMQKIGGVVSERVQQATYKFPDMPPVTHTERLAMTVKNLHCINLIFRDSTTNGVSSCAAVIAPGEPIANIGKISSHLGTLCVQNPEDRDERRRMKWGLKNPWMKKIGSNDVVAEASSGGIFATSHSGEQLTEEEKKERCNKCCAAWMHAYIKGVPMVCWCNPLAWYVSLCVATCKTSNPEKVDEYIKKHNVQWKKK